MRYRVVLSRTVSGLLQAECPDFPGCRVEGASREDALEHIRNAIGFYEENCPCDVTKASGLDLEIVDRTGFWQES